MNVLVIGGTRFFGKRFVKKLIDKNYQVTVLTRGQAHDDLGSQVERLIADRTNRDSFLAAVKGKSFDVVVDQICMNAAEAEVVAEAFSGKIKQLIFTSTLSVYPFRGNLKEQEFDPLAYTPVAPKNNAEIYAEGKRAAERAYLKSSGYIYSCLRIPIVLGEDDYTLRLKKQVESIAQGEPLYFPELQAKMSYIHADDAAAAILWLLEGEKTGAYNFSAVESIAHQDLVGLIENAVGRKLVSPPQGEEEKYHSPFGIPKDWFMNVEKAKQEGFRSKDLKNWLPDLVNHYARLIRM